MSWSHKLEVWPKKSSTKCLKVSVKTSPFQTYPVNVNGFTWEEELDIDKYISVINIPIGSISH